MIVLELLYEATKPVYMKDLWKYFGKNFMNNNGVYDPVNDNYNVLCEYCTVKRYLFKFYSWLPYVYMYIINTLL